MVFSGYGFTKEDDFVYALDAATGREVARLKVKSGPEYLVMEGDALQVRTYDRDYVIDVSVARAD